MLLGWWITKQFSFEGSYRCTQTILGIRKESQDENIETSSWNEFSKGNKFDIPNLQVYIVDLWPSKEEEIPNDHDKVLDRKNDITYQNKTDYDQKVAVFVSDYIDLVEKIGDIAVEAIDSINDEDKKKTLTSTV